MPKAMPMAKPMAMPMPHLPKIMPMPQLSNAMPDAVHAEYVKTTDDQRHRSSVEPADFK